MDEEFSKQNIGNAGEFYAAYLLSSKNFVITVTLGRNEGYDLIAVSPTGKMSKISVKARNSTTEQRFPLSPKDEVNKGEDFFYAFIRLNDFADEPDYWIVPSSVVSRVISESHKKYLDIPAKDGSKHKDSKMRNFWINDNKLYPENWGEEMKKYYKN